MTCQPKRTGNSANGEQVETVEVQYVEKLASGPHCSPMSL